MKKPSEAKIVVCGIVRNAEAGLRRNVIIVDKVLSHFCDYRVLIYENDSIDATKKLLQCWKQSHEDKVIISINQTDSSSTIPSSKSVSGVNPFFCRKRIDKMASLRNKYMDMLDEYIAKTNYMPDYLMVVDLDVAQLSENSVMTSFEGEIEWDAVCAFGYSTSPSLKRRYHDSYALTLWGDQNNPQTEEKIFSNARMFGSLKPDNSWIRIASGFGGLAIYKFEAVNGLRYSVPSLANNDIRVEVKCEHFSLCKQMIERGYDKIYLNPAMVLKYQNLSMKIIWHSLMRMLKIE